MSWLLSHWSELLTGVLAFVGGASVLVKVVAPFTSTDLDDKAARWIDKIHSFLKKLALN